MKKIFTLLFSVTIFATAFAQRDEREWSEHNQQSNNPYVKNYPNGEYNRGGNWDSRNNQYNNQAIAQRDFQIAKINRDIDFRIQQVTYDRFMNRRQKRREIEYLESQRVQQIQSCHNQYNTVYNRGSYGRNTPTWNR
jgi:hypothetical protein